MKKFSFKSFFIGVLIMVVLIASAMGGAIADRLFYIKPLDLLVPGNNSLKSNPNTSQRIQTEESVVIDVAEKVSPSVVTVGIKKTTTTPGQIRINPLNPFNPFEQVPGQSQTIEQDIGSGFIVSKDGYIVTNKHVVEDTSAEYKVITSDNKEYKVTKINKDPNNDLAVIKIDADNLTPVEMGDSSNLKVGQFVIAIGTSLGEFRHTVTTGVISGLGRSITAGSGFSGDTEQLEDIIQTDAAINFGNSGGPLLDSQGKVIGVNVARADSADNIGFALPINLIKTALDQFNSEGGFPQKAFLGVNYQLITQRTAILNDVPQGAYVLDVVPDSAADKAGIRPDDIILKFDGKNISDYENGISDIIKDYKPGDQAKVHIWRNGNEQDLTVTLSQSEQ
jgi:serine protease Do